MVALLRENETERRLPKYTRRCVEGVTLLDVTLPRKLSPRRQRSVARQLQKEGVRRVLMGERCPPMEMERYGLSAVTPLPLYRALGDQLALASVAECPVAERRIALRGIRADGAAFLLAERLCPQVGTLILDFEREDGALFDYLRRRFGAVALPPRSAPPPQVSVELDRRQGAGERRLKLWGTPYLEGVELWAEVPIPQEVPAAAWLTLLWESGRLPLTAFEARRRE